MEPPTAAAAAYHLYHLIDQLLSITLMGCQGAGGCLWHFQGCATDYRFGVACWEGHEGHLIIVCLVRWCVRGVVCSVQQQGGGRGGGRVDAHLWLHWLHLEVHLDGLALEGRGGHFTTNDDLRQVRISRVWAGRAGRDARRAGRADRDTRRAGRDIGRRGKGCVCKRW